MFGPATINAAFVKGITTDRKLHHIYPYIIHTHTHTHTHTLYPFTLILLLRVNSTGEIAPALCSD